MNKPVISIVVPTRNEEQNIERCLKSIFIQKYPSKYIEVIVVDDNSKDGTLKIVKKYPVRIIRHNNRHGEIGKKIGLDASRGDFFIYLDADTELGSRNTLKLLLKPFYKNKEVVATFTKESAGKNSNSIEKYLSMDALQRDPVFSFFSPGVEECIKEKKEYGYLCQYGINKIPPAGRCVYKKKIIQNLIRNEREFLELDMLVKLVESGYTQFVYVPDAIINHYHVKNLADLIRKRYYNLSKVYVRFYDKKKYKWITLDNWKNRIKIFIWVLYANSLIGPLFNGIRKSVRYKTLLGMYDFIVTPLLTDLYVYHVVFNSRIRNKLLSEK